MAEPSTTYSVITFATFPLVPLAAAFLIFRRLGPALARSAGQR